MVVLVRCDDRLIHGQCMTVVVKNYDVKEIIVVDDFTATNSVLKTVFTKAVPANMKAEVYTVKEAAPKIEEALHNDVRTLVLMKSPVVYEELLKEVPDLPKELNVGPMSKRKGTAQVHPAIHLMPDEMEAVKDIANDGVHVYFQQVPEQPRIEWEDIKNKY